VTSFATSSETSASPGLSLPRFWILTVAILVTGCSFLEFENRPFYCPTINILADAASTTLFRDGQGRDIIDVTHKGEIRDILATECGYDFDKDIGGGLLTVNFSLMIGAEIGPAADSRKMAFDYFVSITDEQLKILQKEFFRFPVEFSGNRTHVLAEDEKITLDIPLTAEQDGRQFKIFIGFQLSQEQLEYNRRHRVGKVR
jgi:hypothetical protein